LLDVYTRGKCSNYSAVRNIQTQVDSLSSEEVDILGHETLRNTIQNAK